MNCEVRESNRPTNFTGHVSEEGNVKPMCCHPDFLIFLVGFVAQFAVVKTVFFVLVGPQLVTERILTN